MVRGGLADQAFFDEVDEEADALAARFRAFCVAMPTPSADRMFSHVYAEPHEQIERQRHEYLEYAAGFESDAARRTRQPARRAGTEMAPQTVTLGKAINMGLRRAMEDNDKVVILGEDIGKLGGVFRITDGLQKDFGEHRVLDTPLAESGIIGTAVGLALRGYRPVCEIQFDGFVFPGFDQIISQVAKVTYRSQGAWTMPVVIRIPYGGGIGAVEHHAESPESFFCHIAGLRVVACSNPQDAYDMIQDSIACEDPVIFFEPKRRYWEKGAVEAVADSAPGCAASDLLDRAAQVRHRGHAGGVRRDHARRTRGRRRRGGRGPLARRVRPAHAVTAGSGPGDRVGAPDRPLRRGLRGTARGVARRPTSPPGSPRRPSIRWPPRCCG